MTDAKNTSLQEWIADAVEVAAQEWAQATYADTIRSMVEGHDPVEALAGAVKKLTPKQKVSFLKGLGMQRIGMIHDLECGAAFTMDTCNCVEPEGTWTNIPGTEEFLGDTWEQRLARSKKRS